MTTKDVINKDLIGKDKAIDFYSRAAAVRRLPAPIHTRRDASRPQAGHKFKVGQILLFSPSIFEPATRRGSYKVVSLLPADGGDNQYRLKSETDGHERVVREGQLALG